MLKDFKLKYFLYFLSCFLSWTLALCVIIFYVTFYSTHANATWYEQSATFYDIWAVHVGGLAHIPFYALIRPGFLINNFFMFFGISLGALRTFSIFLTLLSSGILVVSLISFLRPALFKNYYFLLAFPWIILLEIPSVVRPLDYESSPILFLVLAMALFLHRDKHRSLPCLIGLFVAYASFASLSLMPAGVLIALGLIFIFQDQPAKRSGFLSLSFIFIIYFSYYIFSGVALRLWGACFSGALPGSHLGSHLGATPFLVFPDWHNALLIYGYSSGCLILPFVLAWLAFDFFKQFKFFKAPVSLQSFILILLISETYLKLYGGVGFVLDGLVLFLAVLLVLSLCLLANRADTQVRPYTCPSVMPGERRKYKDIKFIFMAGYFLFIFQHIFSRSYYMWTTYYVSFFWVAVACLLAVSVFGFSKFKLKIKDYAYLGISILCLLLMAFSELAGFMNLNLRGDAPGFSGLYSENWGSFLDNTSPSFMGENVPEDLGLVYKNIDQAYLNNHCESKSFLVIAYPGVYYMVKRLAPFDLIWLSQEKTTPFNKNITDEFLIHWLSQQKSWCVIGANTQYSRVFPELKNFLLPTQDYLDQRSNSKKYLGYSFTEAQNFYLWVKS